MTIDGFYLTIPQLIGAAMIVVPLICFVTWLGWYDRELSTAAIIGLVIFAWMFGACMLIGGALS